MKQMNVTIDDQKKQLNIPESWNDVTVKQYRTMSEIDMEQDELFQRIKIVAALLNLEQSLVEMIFDEDFFKIEAELMWATQDINLSNTEPFEYVEVEGEKFYLYREFNKLTMGEQISLKILMEKGKNNMLSVYNDLLCILLRKKKENGKLETFKSDMMSRAPLFDDLFIGQVNQVLVFFSSIKED